MRIQEALEKVKVGVTVEVDTYCDGKMMGTVTGLDEKDGQPVVLYKELDPKFGNGLAWCYVDQIIRVIG